MQAQPVRTTRTDSQPPLCVEEQITTTPLGALGPRGWPEQPQLMIGRDPRCDWVLPGPRVAAWDTALRVQEGCLQVRTLREDAPDEALANEAASLLAASSAGDANASTPAAQPARPWHPVNVWEFEYPWLDAPDPAQAGTSLRASSKLRYAALACLVVAAQLHRAHLPAVWLALAELWPRVQAFWDQWAAYLSTGS